MSGHAHAMPIARFFGWTEHIDMSRVLCRTHGLTTRNKKLLGATGIATRSKDATNGTPGLTTRNKKTCPETPRHGPSQGTQRPDSSAGEAGEWCSFYPDFFSFNHGTGFRVSRHMCLSSKLQRWLFSRMWEMLLFAGCVATRTFRTR